mmetsp:Transcript_11446/g.49307  ORF Transcript_11446/g.49307 Transcript_11446/m.49307 type:complete len:305 (+) Transcript_11446:1357-2271(+)
MTRPASRFSRLSRTPGGSDRSSHRSTACVFTRSSPPTAWSSSRGSSTRSPRVPWTPRLGRCFGTSPRLRRGPCSRSSSAGCTARTWTTLTVSSSCAPRRVGDPRRLVWSTHRRRLESWNGARRSRPARARRGLGSRRRMRKPTGRWTRRGYPRGRAVRPAARARGTARLRLRLRGSEMTTRGYPPRTLCSAVWSERFWPPASSSGCCSASRRPRRSPRACPRRWTITSLSPWRSLRLNSRRTRRAGVRRPGPSEPPRRSAYRRWLRRATRRRREPRRLGGRAGPRRSPGSSSGSPRWPRRARSS